MIIEFIELILLSHYYYDYFIIMANSLLFLSSIFICNFILLFLIRKPLIIVANFLKHWCADINNWFEKKSYILEHWCKRIKYYVLIFISTILILHLFFTKFIPADTDPNSARYVLSAMIQSQAAIIALVVSLLLVAVQLTTSSYSKRATSFVKRNPDFWIVLSSYMLSMSFSMIILKLIENDNVHELYISLSIYFTIFTFIILFPFLINVLNILKPSSFIQESNNIITQKYIASCEKKYDRPDDPFHSIMDFFKDSILKHDFDITREILTIIKSKIIQLISSNPDENTLDYFYFHLRKMADFAASKDDGTLNEILYIFDKIIFLLNEDDSIHIKLETIDSLQFIGQLAAKNSLDYSTENALELIIKVGQNSSIRDLEDTILTRSTVSAIGNIGISATKSKLITSIPIEYLYNIGKCASENKTLNDLTLSVLRYIEYIYMYAVTEEDLQYSTLKSIEALKEISIICAKNDFELPVIKTAEFILNMSPNEKILYTIAGSFRDIGKITIEKGYEKSTLKVIELLERITNNNLGEKSIAADVSVIYLFEIGEVALENQSEYSDYILKTLKDISHIKLAEKNGSVLIGSIESLKKMGIAAINHSSVNDFSEIQCMLMNFGQRAINLNMYADFLKITNAFYELGNIASIKDYENEFIQIRFSLELLGVLAIREGNDAEPLNVLETYGRLGKFLHGNKKPIEIEKIIGNIASIGKLAIEKDNSLVIISVVSTIYDIFSSQYISSDVDKIEYNNSELIGIFINKIYVLFKIGILASDNRLGSVSLKVSVILNEMFRNLHGKISEENIEIIPAMIVGIGVYSLKNKLNFVGEEIAFQLIELDKLKILNMNDFMNNRELVYEEKGAMFDEFQNFKKLCTFYKNNDVGF